MVSCVSIVRGDDISYQNNKNFRPTKPGVKKNMRSFMCKHFILFTF